MKMWLGLLAILCTGAPAFSTPASLENELKSLDIKEAPPTNRVRDRLYSVQMRAVPIAGKIEALAEMGQNYTGSGFLRSNQFSAGAQYHLNDDWSAAIAYTRVNNQFSSEAERLLAVSGFLPDVDFVKSRMEIRAQYNLFYGKFRFTRTQALAFDNYLGLGLVSNELQSGTSVGPLADYGFAFWLAKWASFHVGVKDYYYRENRVLTNGYSHNVHGYVALGALF